jgi:pyrroloquinoline quinone biosynthesis protein B
MILRILGSAAGGGFPQLNCRCANCKAVRERRQGFRQRTQASVAISTNGVDWTLLNASPDLRQQIAAAPDLWPRVESGVRSCPIEAVVLTNGDVDAVAGLLSLREGFAFDLFAPQGVLELLDANVIFGVLEPDLVHRMALTENRTFRTSSGLEVESFRVPSKAVPHFDKRGQDEFSSQLSGAMGLRISDPGGASFCYVPCCAEVDETLATNLRGAQLVLFDGTLYSDDEMIAQGLSRKTGRLMGHISMSGPKGSIAQLADLGIQRRIFTHVNNSNPVLNELSDERISVERAGWEIAFDGMEIRL